MSETVAIEKKRQQGEIAVAIINNAVRNNGTASVGIVHFSEKQKEDLIKFIKEVQATLD